MEGIVTLIIIIISIVGWVANAMQEQNAKQQKPGGGQPQRPRRLQDEIENFLREVQDQQKRPEDQDRQERRADLDPFAEPPRPRERPATSPPMTSKRQQRKQQRAAQNQAKSRGREPRQKLAIPAASPIAQDSMSEATRTVGPAPEATLGEILGFGKGADDRLQTLLSADQMAALKRLAEDRGPIRPTPTAGNLAKMLSSRDHIRSAFVVNEILSPPLSMRKPKSS